MGAKLMERNTGDNRTHNLQGYQATCQDFDWQQARSAVTGYGQGINIAYEAVDRHVDQGQGDQVAIRWLSKRGGVEDLSYRQLMQQTNRFANVLNDLGVGVGDAVYSLAGRVPALYIALLGSLKNGSVFTPLFSAFGPEPVRSRMEIGQAKVLLTTEKLYRKKIAPWRDQLPSLRHILLFDIKSQCPTDCIDLDRAMADAGSDFDLCETAEEDTALLHFTSGTTGKPKGVVHVHCAVIHHIHTGFYALDLQPGDIYWCTADPGWVTGTSYGVIAPLCLRATLLVDEAEFDAERWYRILQDQRVTVWYTAPTAIRMLMKAGSDLVGRYDLSRLRFLASVGEPLNPEAVIWSQKVFGIPFHDNWWQTETGGIMIANFPGELVKPGSMGRPLPGVTATIMEKTVDGRYRPVPEAGAPGELALKAGWPSMFRGYLHQSERYQQCFQQGWYLTGDLATRDSEGYFWFIGRADDLIKSAGHLIGPFEVESALVEHPAVAEAAVIGMPDEVAGELVKAYVALNTGYTASDELNKSIMALTRKKLGPSVAPRTIEFRDNLPKTRSGKIMRRLLKARELGLPIGDISTLECDESA